MFGKSQHGSVAAAQRVDERENLFGPVCALNAGDARRQDRERRCGEKPIQIWPGRRHKEPADECDAAGGEQGTSGPLRPGLEEQTNPQAPRQPPDDRDERRGNTVHGHGRITAESD